MEAAVSYALDGLIETPAFKSGEMTQFGSNARLDECDHFLHCLQVLVEVRDR
jgi:hypothetical protein